MESISKNNDEPVIRLKTPEEKLSHKNQTDLKGEWFVDSRKYNVLRIFANNQSLSDEEVGKLVRTMFRTEEEAKNKPPMSSKELELLFKDFDLMVGGANE